MGSTWQKVEAIAVRGSCGGKAQGRHSRGVACEFLQGKNKNKKQLSSGRIKHYYNTIVQYWLFWSVTNISALKPSLLGDLCLIIIIFSKKKEAGI